jgi:hypothetical protein
MHIIMIQKLEGEERPCCTFVSCVGYVNIGTRLWICGTAAVTRRKHLQRQKDNGEMLYYGLILILLCATVHDEFN